MRQVHGAKYPTVTWVGPQYPKEVAKDTVRDLTALVGELAALRLHTQRQRRRWWKLGVG
jgi:hypothetical protein